MFAQCLALASLAGLLSPTLAASQHLQAADILSTPYSLILSSSGIASSVPLFPNGTLDVQAWGNLTNTACVATLSKLPRATNPSGTALCYNLPVLDTSTGKFEADLTVYQISEQRADWKDISLGEAGLEITFDHAIVAVKNVTAAGGGEDQSSDASTPRPWRVYSISGKIKDDEFSSDMSM